MYRYFRLFTEVNQLPFESPAHRAPLVLLNQHAPVQTETKILIDQLIQLRDNRLKQRRNRKRVVDARGNITNTKFERREVWMRSNVPPDLFAVVDTAGLNQQIDVALERTVRIEVIGNVGARKLFEDFCAIRFETCVMAHPEGRRSRE